MYRIAYIKFLIPLLCFVLITYSGEKENPSNHLCIYTKVIMRYLKDQNNHRSKLALMEFTICLGDSNYQVKSPEAQELLKEVALIDDNNKICEDIRAAFELQRKIDLDSIPSST